MPPGASHTPVIADANAQGRLSLWSLTLADILLIALLPGLFHVTFTGPLSFADKDVLFDGLGSTDSKTGNQLATLALFGVGVFQFIKYRMSAVRLLTIALPFLPFVAWAILSTAWSDHPGLSLRRSMRLTIEMAGVILLAMSYANDPGRLFRIVFYVCLGIIIADLVILPIPALSWSPIGYVGLHYHKQYTGRFLFIAITVFMAAITYGRSTRDRRLGWLGLAVGALLLPLTQAKTIWVALPVALASAAVMVGLVRADLRKAVIATTCFVAGGVTVIALFVGLEPDVYLVHMFGDATLTGRDQIWRFAFSQSEGRDISGVGYGALWQTGPEVVDRLKQGYRIYVVNEAHNGYIDLLVQTGNVGAVCLGVALTVMFACLARDAGALADTNNPVPFVSLALFAGMLIVNLTDSTMFLPYTSLWAEPVAFYALTRARALSLRERTSQLHQFRAEQ